MAGVEEVKEKPPVEGAGVDELEEEVNENPPLIAVPVEEVEDGANVNPVSLLVPVGWLILVELVTGNWNELPVGGVVGKISVPVLVRTISVFGSSFFSTEVGKSKNGERVEEDSAGAAG